MEPPSTGNITVINESNRRVRVTQLGHAAKTALSRHGKDHAAVCILLTDDENIRRLNHEFRGIDEATDVLTFPAAAFPGAPLGDIAISVEYAQRQAALRKVSLSQELGYLAIHGALHLIGFDDETDEDRLAMVGEMNDSAVAAGLKPDTNWYSILHGEEK
ncbi:hypothetical protein BH11ARM1_BH11ARM1_11370 [soil metagenome]